MLPTKPHHKRFAPRSEWMPRGPGPKRSRKRMRKAGKKARVWINFRRSLKEEFERAGLTTCEARFDGCRVNDELGFAHSLKRRHITTETEMREVALLCNRCHDRAEFMGEERMSQLIRKIIERRAYRLAEMEAA